MKEKKYYKLTTKYVDEMDKNTPWNEYPRPSMVRDSFLCLNGEWDFAISTEKEFDNYARRILVPFPPESALSGIEESVERGSYLHYRRSFTIPEGFKKDRLLLHFGAVDTVCAAMINGRTAICHDGGYLPFSVDITDLCHDGENEIYVRIIDELDLAYPYGKQTKKRGGMWYTPVSGIWQTVWIESVAKNHISSLRITPSMSDVLIEVEGGVDKKRITLSDGETYEFEGDSIRITPKDIILWTPENPHLYSFTLESGEDKVESYFALREIGIKEIGGISRLTLNGKAYLFNGLLDQGYYPDGLFLPATSRGYEDDILLAKSHGFNMLRKHIKVEPEIFYNLCDRLGVVVFQDMINNSNYRFIYDTILPTIGFKRLPDRYRTRRERAIFEQEMYATIKHLYNFPSVMYYTIFNEGWGQFDADKMYRKAKEFDPTRIYDATSGWFYRKESDVDSRHVYFKPVKIGKTSGRPIVISEFGGYSHRVAEHLFGDENYGYSSHETKEGFEEAFIRLYSSEIKPLISKGICALVYTQVSDVEDETNGIITYDRAVEKMDRERVRKVMDELYKEISTI